MPRFSAVLVGLAGLFAVVQPAPVVARSAAAPDLLRPQSVLRGRGSVRTTNPGARPGEEAVL